MCNSENCNFYSEGFKNCELQILQNCKKHRSRNEMQSNFVCNRTADSAEHAHRNVWTRRSYLRYCIARKSITKWQNGFGKHSILVCVIAHRWILLRKHTKHVHSAIYLGWVSTQEVPISGRFSTTFRRKRPSLRQGLTELIFFFYSEWVYAKTRTTKHTGVCFNCVCF